MKTLSTILVAVLLLTACSGSTEYGECIGLGDDKDPALTYRISIWNAFWSVVFIETIIVPIEWVVDYAECPTGKKAVPK